MNRQRFQTDVLPLKDKLFRLAMCITLNRDDAEDIVQDTMLRVWDAQDQWSEIQNMEAYCITVCRRLALDHMKRAAAANLRLNPELHDHPIVPDGYNMERQEEVGMIREAMSRLPESQRTIMELREMEGKTYGEIAQLTEMSESQVKVYLHRARKKIRTIIERIENYGL